jgi:hypothetical protein
MNVDLFIKPVALWETLEKFQKAIADAFPEKPIHGWNITTAFGGDSVNLGGVNGKEIRNNEAFKQKLQEYKKKPYVEASQINITLPNGGTMNYIAEENHRGPFLRLNIPDHQRDRDIETALGEALNKHFTIIPKSEIAAATLSEVQLKGFQFAERVVAALASETAKIATASTTSFEAFVAGVKQRSLELEDQFQKKADELEERFTKKSEQLDVNHAAKLKDLEEREKAHTEAVKQFELRNNTAVRRDLLKEIRTKIEQQKTIEISPATTGKRRIIHIVCCTTLTLAVVMIAVLGYKIFTLAALDWKLLVPLGTSTALFVTTAIYYIKWNDQWFRDHARVEFENRKFSADILRASWVAELFFEWADKKGINMPADLVGSFTKNLFDPTSSDGRHHPIDQFNDLLKNISSLEVGKGNVKVTKKDAKEEAKS